MLVFRDMAQPFRRGGGGEWCSLVSFYLHSNVEDDVNLLSFQRSSFGRMNTPEIEVTKDTSPNTAYLFKTQSPVSRTFKAAA